MCSIIRQIVLVLWCFKICSVVYGIFVDQNMVWVGNDFGEVFVLMFLGEVDCLFCLLDGVKCFVSDQFCMFVGCDDGNVYDLSGKFFFMVYEVESKVVLLWFDLYGGILGVFDSGGGVYVFDVESDQQWGYMDDWVSMGWMVCVDVWGVYYGYLCGVGMFDWESGFLNWYWLMWGSVLFGWQEGNDLYVGISVNFIQCFMKVGEYVQDY